MSRLVDDRGRLFGKINVIDLLVLALIIALAVIIALRATGSDAVETGTAQKVPVKISVEMELTDLPVIEAIKTSEGPVSDIDGRYIGAVDEVSVSEIEPVKLTVQGQKYTVESKPTYDVTVVVAGEGYIEDDGIHIGSFAARVGATVQVVGPGWEGWAKIVGAEQSTTPTE